MYSKIKLDKIDVWCISVTGVMNSSLAFQKLESNFKSLKGRRFYGCLIGYPKNGVYRACVAKLPEDNFQNLESWMIPGGTYLKAKIKDWEKHTSIISETFKSMAKQEKVDSLRPYIEFYRRQRELILFSPLV